MTTDPEQHNDRGGFDSWLRIGVALGYCTEQYCMTHDSTPMHVTEERAWEAGADPCCHVVRLGRPEDWEYPLVP